MPFVKAECQDCEFKTEEKSEAKEHAVKHDGKHSVVKTLKSPK